MLEALIGANASIHAKNEKGQIPLHLAAQKGNIPAVGILLACQSDIHDKDKQGFTPLYIAEQNSSEAVMRALLASKQTTEFPTTNRKRQPSSQSQPTGGGEYVTEQIRVPFKLQPPNNPVPSIYTPCPKETPDISSGSVYDLIPPCPSISIVADKNKGQAGLLEGVNWLPSSKVTTDTLLGKGAFGKVYGGHWGQIPVAIKEINLEAIKSKFSGNEAGKNLSTHEIEKHAQYAWQWEVACLSMLSHPNLVQFYGIYQPENTGEIHLVMECCEGSLAARLGEESELAPTWHKLLAMGLRNYLSPGLFA